MKVVNKREKSSVLKDLINLEDQCLYVDHEVVAKLIHVAFYCFPF